MLSRIRGLSHVAFFMATKNGYEIVYVLSMVKPKIQNPQSKISV